MFESCSDSDDIQQYRRLLIALQICCVRLYVVLTQLNKPEGEDIMQTAAKSAIKMWPRTQKSIDYIMYCSNKVQ